MSEYTIEGDDSMRWDVIASPPKVTAIVSGFGTAEGVGRYLPDGWSVDIAAEGNGRVLALISGPDGGGWGFDNYVAPRLGSGSYGVMKIDADAGYLAVSGARGMLKAR